MTQTLTLHAAAAEALAVALPTRTSLKPVPAASGAHLRSREARGYLATFVGALSADIALTLNGAEDLGAAAGAGTGPVLMEDILRPAFEAAAAVLGTGVLGDIRLEDATALYADDDAVIFELHNGPAVEGTLAIRIHEHGPSGATPRIAGPVGSEKLSRINNVEMSLTVEIGRTRMSVRDVLGLEPGGVIELDRSAGAPADVLLNGRLIAHGEVVVVDQDYAVRITKILDVAEGAL